MESRLLLWARVGRVEIVLADGVHPLGPGDWLFTPYGAGIVYRPQGPAETAGVHLAPELPATAAGTFGVAHDPPTIDAGPVRDAAHPGLGGIPAGNFARHQPLQHLAEYCVWWYRRCREADAARVLGRLLVAEIVRARAADRRTLPAPLSRALEVCEGTIGIPEVGDLCRTAGVSRATLARLFRRHLGCGPATWATRAQVHRAADLLRTTDLPVAAVATAVGFGDPAYFSRVFRRHQGLSPRAWRDQHPGPPRV